MTTRRDHGSSAPGMLACPIKATSVYSSMVLGLRDMRWVHDRDATTGEGQGSASWVGLTVGMVILDTLSEPGLNDVGRKWEKLLTSYGVGQRDANAIYRLRCSLLHGYYVPELADGREVQLQGDQNAYAVDTETAGLVSVSVPVFCRCLVERIAFEAKDQWDKTLIDARRLDRRQ